MLSWIRSTVDQERRRGAAAVAVDDWSVEPRVVRLRAPILLPCIRPDEVASQPLRIFSVHLSSEEVHFQSSEQFHEGQRLQVLFLLGTVSLRVMGTVEWVVRRKGQTVGKILIDPDENQAWIQLYLDDLAQDVRETACA